MYKNNAGKWVDGSAAKAKYHLQVRCNSKMMEMTSYYLNELCGDGTPPRETIMTARAKVNDKTGEIETPKKTRVKKYSFTYAMAFERLSQGKGLVSRNDRPTMKVLEELIGLVRQILPMATDDVTRESINSWLKNLREAYDFIDNGVKPLYLTDFLGCWPELLQSVMKDIYRNNPDEEWRIDLKEMTRTLRRLGIHNDDVFVFGDDKEKRGPRELWRERGKLEQDTRYNIRMSSRFPAEDYNSETVRGWLEWIYDVPACTNKEDREAIAQDIDALTAFIKEARRYPRTVRGKGIIGFELKLTLANVRTNTENFIINKKE
jgi:hypothetical protein